MSKIEPTLAAPMAPSRIDFAAVLARQSERDARIAALRPANKERLFDGLTAAGITHVTVTFDGAGDSGQIESIGAWSGETAVDFPATEIDYAALDYSRWPFHQSLWQKGIALVVRLLARVRMEGFEKIPSTGCFLAATNHMHILDVPLYFSMAPRRTICFVSDNWQNTPLLGLFLKKVGQVIFVIFTIRT